MVLQVHAGYNTEHPFGNCITRPAAHAQRRRGARRGRAAWSASAASRALTFADVAREVGLAPSTLAERYGSKRALLLAALEPAPDGVAAVFEAARAEHDAPLDALHGALAALSAPVRTREAYANHLGVLALDVGDPDFRRIAERWFARVLEELRALVADGRGARRPGRRAPTRPRSRGPCWWPTTARSRCGRSRAAGRSGMCCAAMSRPCWRRGGPFPRRTRVSKA